MQDSSSQIAPSLSTFQDHGSNLPQTDVVSQPESLGLLTNGQVTLVASRQSVDQLDPNSRKLTNDFDAKVWWLIRYNKKFRIRWDLFVMTLAVWNCFSIPFGVAFSPGMLQSGFVEAVNFVIDAIFLLDLIFNFRTTYFQSKTGDEIFDTKKIAIRYLRKLFIIDLLSTIPFDVFISLTVADMASSSEQTLKLLGLLKLIRILRLTRIINYMRTGGDVKVTFKLVQLILFLCMYVHVVGCMWFIVADLGQEWIPPTDFLYGETDLYESSVAWQYWISIYTSVSILVLGEVAPRSIAEAALAAFLIITGSLITAIMIGQISVHMSSLNKKLTDFQVTQDTTNTIMKNLKIPSQLQRDIHDYIVHTQGFFNQNEEFKRLMLLLSPSLKREVIEQISAQFIKKNELFRQNPYIVRMLISAMHHKFSKPEDIVVEQGTSGQNIYFIAKGELQVSVVDHQDQLHFPAKLISGQHFGEIGAIFNIPRTATVECLNYWTIAELEKEAFDEIVKECPKILKQLKAGLMWYKDTLKLFIIQMLDNISYLEDLSDYVQEDLIYHLGIESYNAGSYIFKPGMNLDSILLLVRGEVELSCTIKSRNLHTYKLKSNWINMEPRVDRKKHQYSRWWRLTKRFKKYAYYLKDRPDMLPLFGEQGVVGSVERENQDSRYFQEIVLDYLQPGTILNSTIALVDNTTMLQAKAITNVKIYKLSSEWLKRFAGENFTLSQKYKAARAPYIKDVNTSPAMDYIHHWGERNPDPRDIIRYKFKNAVLKVIQNKRLEIRGNVYNLAHNLFKLARGPNRRGTRRTTVGTQKTDSNRLSVVIRSEIHKQSTIGVFQRGGSRQNTRASILSYNKNPFPELNRQSGISHSSISSTNQQGSAMANFMNRRRSSRFDTIGSSKTQKSLFGNTNMFNETGDLAQAKLDQVNNLTDKVKGQHTRLQDMVATVSSISTRLDRIAEAVAKM